MKQFYTFKIKQTDCHFFFFLFLGCSIKRTKLFGQFFQLWHAQSEATMLQDKSENLSLENIDWWTSHVDAVLTDATYESLTKDQIIWLEDFTSFQWNASINVTIKNFGNIAALVASPIIGNQICEVCRLMKCLNCNILCLELQFFLL